jgi:hypothetical protein
MAAPPGTPTGKVIKAERTDHQDKQNTVQPHGGSDQDRKSYKGSRVESSAPLKMRIEDL